MGRPSALGSLGLAVQLSSLASCLRVPEQGRVAFVDGLNPEPCKFEGFLSKCDAHLERIKIKRVEKPRPRRGAALVRVRASAINAHDWEDMMFAKMKHFRLGLDLAGTVEAVGEGCSWRPGDEVWGTGFDETDADYVVIRCGMLGRKPANLTFAEAATLPISGTTALGALWKANIPWRPAAGQPGPTVLVLGGAGGSGSVGVQIAKAFGASKVIATCSPSNFDFVKGLGADQVIDYHTSNWWEVLGEHSVDFIYDCVMQQGTGVNAYKVLRDGGSYVALLPDSLAPAEVAMSRPTVKQQFYLNLMEKSTKNLDVLRQWVEEGKLKPTLDSTYSLDDIQEAFRHAIGRHVAGKVVLRMDG